MAIGHLVARFAHPLAGCAVALSITPSVRAEEILEFGIPPQRLETALLAFANQTGAQVAVSSDSVVDLNTKGVSGRLSPQLALAQLVEGSALEVHSQGEHSFSLLARAEPASAATATQTPQNSDQQDSIEGKKKAPKETGDAGVRVGSGSLRIETVVVTAQKREQRLQDVPISLAVLGSDEIARRGLIGMEDFLRSIPSVNQIDNGAVSNAIVIRGITTSPQFENFASGTTVATYFGETPITAGGGLGGGGIDIRPVDLQRIEVLRGPQGTTYGSASLGGALRLIPKEPELDGFRTRVVASYSNTENNGGDNSMVQGVINLPIVADELAVRAVGYRYDESGFYRNTAGMNPATIAVAEAGGIGDYLGGYVQDDVGRMLTTGGRLSALWQATDRFRVALHALSQKVEQDGSPVATTAQYEQARFPIAPQGRRRGEMGEIADTDMDLFNVTLDYDLAWAQLTSTTSWIESGSLLTESSNYSNGVSSTAPSDFSSFTTEMRLASSLSGPFQYLVGLFYEEVENDYEQVADWPGSAATNPFGTAPGFIYEENRDLDQRAIFGEVSYALTDKVTLTGGGRYFKYDKTEGTLAEGGAFGVPIGSGVASVLQTEESDASYKVSLGYKPTQNSLMYASWSDGYRLGRPTAGLPAATCDVNNDGVIDGTGVSIASTRSIAPDFLDNYEVGAKFTLMDQRISIDTAAYHIEWDGLPVRTVAPCNLSYVANVGAATSDGIEAQVSFLATEKLRLEFGGSYTDATLSEAAPTLNAPEGARLPGSPKFNANFSAEYTFPIAANEVFVRADSFYAGDFYGDLAESPNTKAGDYIKIDARTGIHMGSLSVELFVRNLTNEDAFTWRWTAPRDPFYGYRLRPRTIGIQLGYTFE